MPSKGLLLKVPTVKLISRHIDLQSVDCVLCMLVTDRNGILGRVNLDEMAEGFRNGRESDWNLDIANILSRQATRLFANNIGLKQSLESEVQSIRRKISLAVVFSHLDIRIRSY